MSCDANHINRHLIFARVGVFILSSGKALFGHEKPRREVCYSTNGDAYVYSGRAQPTTLFPRHVQTLVPVILRAVEKLVPDNRFTKLDHGIDISYDDRVPRGGSNGAHRDDENAEWGLVAIVSLGQTRWLRVRSDTTKQFTNVELRHNSLVCMHGKSFQQRFTHQVDKLAKNEPVGVRQCVNIRFLPSH